MKTITTDLTDKQKFLLREIISFLEQFSDRDQMNAANYLAKYKNAKACEEIGIHLRWAIEREFFNE